MCIVFKFMNGKHSRVFIRGQNNSVLGMQIFNQLIYIMIDFKPTIDLL